MIGIVGGTMNEKMADKILDAAHFLLKWFPNEKPEFRSKKVFRRKPYLRAKHIQNRKVFFDILKQKYQGLNKRDKARRYIVILEIKRKNRKELYLYSIYPT